MRNFKLSERRCRTGKSSVMCSSVVGPVVLDVSKERFDFSLKGQAVFDDKGTRIFRNIESHE